MDGSLEVVILVEIDTDADVVFSSHGCGSVLGCPERISTTEPLKATNSQAAATAPLPGDAPLLGYTRWASRHLTQRPVPLLGRQIHHQRALQAWPRKLHRERSGGRPFRVGRVFPHEDNMLPRVGEVFPCPDEVAPRLHPPGQPLQAVPLSSLQRSICPLKTDTDSPAHTSPQRQQRVEDGSNQENEGLRKRTHKHALFVLPGSETGARAECTGRDKHPANTPRDSRPRRGRSPAPIRRWRRHIVSFLVRNTSTLSGR